GRVREVDPFVRDGVHPAHLTAGELDGCRNEKRGLDHVVNAPILLDESIELLVEDSMQRAVFTCQERLAHGLHRFLRVHDVLTHLREALPVSSYLASSYAQKVYLKLVPERAVL